MATAYEQLESAIKNNETELFYENDPKYVPIDRGDRGVDYRVDYLEMTRATNRYIREHPDKKGVIQSAILSALRESKIGYVIVILEMAAYQLRYGDDLGFLSEEILTELRTQVNLNRERFEERERERYQALDEASFNVSGHHLL
jgi:hypothetical protein